MFFSSSRKAAEQQAAAQAAAAGDAGRRGGATVGVLSLLLFNPTLQPDGDTRESEQQPGGSSSSPATADAADSGGEENLELSQEEKEQEAKIVYSYPPNRDPAERRSQAGLLEGLLMFSRPFAPFEAPLRSISTEKYTIVMEEVEQDFWLAITFAVNALPSFNAVDPGLNKYDQKRIDDDTQEEILLGVLRSMYATFRLLHSRIGLYFERGRQQELADVLADFCPAFLETIDLAKLSVFHAIAGFHFAPVDRLPYLCVPSLIALLQQQYPCIQHAALLLSGCLVYHSMNTPLEEPRPGGPSFSGLDFNDDTLAVLYAYLVSSEGAAAVDAFKLLKPPYARVPTAAARPGGGCSSFGRAITEDGPTNFIFGSAGQFAFLPTIHFADDSTGRLLAVVHEQLLLVLVLDEADKRISDVAFLQLIRAAAVDGPCGLRELNAVLSAEFKKIMKQEDTYRFTYFNNANRAIRVSNRQCLANSPSPPYFKNFCLSFQEVQRLSHMHCKFLGVSAASRPASDFALGCTYTALTSPSAGTESSAAAADGSQAEQEQQPRACGAEEKQMKSKKPAVGMLEGIRTIAVKDAQSGWLIGKRTCDREHFLALDDPKTTFTKALEDASRFSSLHFSNIFV
ncbi:hypothetical protein Efla_005654 [Eimeria flavescens]